MLILSLPYQNTGFIINHQKKHSSFFDLIELRLDYRKILSDIDKKMVKENTILTIRDIREGGIQKIPISEKIKYLQKMHQLTNCYIDIELRNYNNHAFNPKRLIVSYHSQKTKFDENEFESLINKIKQTKSRFIKFVLPIHTFATYFKICAKLKNLKRDYILISSGRLNKLSRFLYKHSGSAGTYVGLDQYKTAKNQLTLSQALFYKLNTIKKTTKIGGLIGGSQIYNSFGLEFYNRYFYKNNLMARYLPFEIYNTRDFIENFLKNPQIPTYGFSITMPYKIDFANYINCRQKPINFINFIDDRFQTANTDKIAFQNALRKFELSSREKILLIGSGGSALTALQELKRYKRVYLTSRNEYGKELAKQYNAEFLKLHKIKNLDFDLIINCTPIGMNGENLLDYFGLSKPKFLLDLPYNRQKKSSIKTLFDKNDYISGKLFWSWQARKQLTYFIRNISS